MKKILIMIMLMSLWLVGCSNNNVSFKAVIESVHDNNIMVTTNDDVGFDIASVSLYDAKIVGELKPGAKILLTIQPEIRESYPVQVTAVKVEVLKSEVEKISAEKAYSMINQGQYDVLLDVRTIDEYNQGHIANATLLPVDQIRSDVEKLITDKNAVILVYCRSGNRSQKASQMLIDLGYTNVYDFGGLNDWPYEIIK